MPPEQTQDLTQDVADTVARLDRFEAHFATLASAVDALGFRLDELAASKAQDVPVVLHRVPDPDLCPDCGGIVPKHHFDDCPQYVDPKKAA